MEKTQFESAEMAENGSQAEQSDQSFGFKRKAYSSGGNWWGRGEWRCSDYLAKLK
jgi:hypothetical protein